MAMNSLLYLSVVSAEVQAGRIFLLISILNFISLKVELTMFVGTSYKVVNMTLDHLPVGQHAIITAVINHSESDAAIAHRLQEIGFIEHTHVFVENHAPFSHDPITVRARGSLFALRRSEAALIHVIEDVA